MNLPETKARRVPLDEAVGLRLAHDITEVRPGTIKGAAFKRGYVLSKNDICYLRRLGKENLYVLIPSESEVHEDDAAIALAGTLMGEGVCVQLPQEGRVSIIAEWDGLLKIDREFLRAFNFCGDVACATLHDNTVVRKGQVVADVRAIPLLIKKKAVNTASNCWGRTRPVISVKAIRKPRTGIVITGNEVYSGPIKDGFQEIISQKIASYGGDITGVRIVPDEVAAIKDALKELLLAGSDLLVTTGGMSVDPDDVTRFAIRDLGACDINYGTAASPGAMILVAYLKTSGDNIIPILGMPACALHARTTVFDLILPRILAGEQIGRQELADLGHGGLCLRCDHCRFPACPFGK